MEFEWDLKKAAANLQKHAIAFTAAIAVFDDPNRLEEDSTRAEYGETRTKAIGLIEGGRIIAVISTDRGRIRRIISARKARKNERERYDQGKTTW